MNYNFSQFKQEAKNIEEWLKKEMSSIRTGRATPAILDTVKVEAYGTLMSISELANISIGDARMLVISPWDMSQAKAIEKAIIVSNLGLSVNIDDKGLKIIFPELTSERRVVLVKMAKQKLEDSKVSLRVEREKVLKDLDKQEKEGSLSKDDQFRFKNELQKILDEINKNLDDIFSKKEKEISE